VQQLTRGCPVRRDFPDAGRSAAGCSATSPTATAGVCRLTLYGGLHVLRLVDTSRSRRPMPRSASPRRPFSRWRASSKASASAANTAPAPPISARIADPRHRGFYSSFQYVTLIGGQLTAIIVLLLLQKVFLTPEELKEWGWRIPFVIGALLAIFAAVMRRTLHETEAFVEAKKSR